MLTALPSFDEPDNPVVVGLRGVGAEDRHDLTIDLEGVGDLGDAARLPGRSDRTGSQFGISQLVQSNCRKVPASYPTPANHVAASLQRVSVAIRAIA